MDKREASGRREPFPSILKKSKSRYKENLLDKSFKIKQEKVESSKKKIEDVNPSLPQGCTPLMYACQQADYKSVVDILNKNPQTVRIRDRGLRCALHYCASSGGASQVARANCADRVLMAAPQLADARDADGLTPLHLAVVHGNVPLVQTLLAAGADVNARDDEHHTVVHWATVCGEVGALRAVLSAGADAATPDQHGGYPLHYAAQMCGAPATTDHQTRGAALEVLRALVKEGGARVDVRDADGRTPILWAASAGSAAAVLALHQAGANVDDSDRDGLTALHCAAARGHTEVLETLVGLCGARVDVADSHGCTPLHYAAALGHADATALLLQHGADAHRQDKKGRSPAHTAAAKGQLETVRMLGARGANLWLRNSKGDLPLHEAVAAGRRELVKWLLDGRPSQVNATNHEGRTPLHIAAATDNADLCRLLLDRGAEVNPVARSSKNDIITPLDCAASRGHRSTAKYLQMHGGVPANKLTDTQIIIDGAPITSLPSRKVTSTKIDVHDQIRIEKREVIEISSPLSERRCMRKKLNRNSDSYDSSDEYKKTKKRYFSKYGSHRKLDVQKSFSDGYESDLKDDDRYFRNEVKKRKERRSKSESSRHKSHSRKENPRSYSGSESLEESQKYTDKKRSKRHRKRSKHRSSTSESSSSGSSDRRNTKRKGKKTSIHIEDTEKKQSVNIVKYKKDEQLQNSEKASDEAIDGKEIVSLKSVDNDLKNSNNVKLQSETEIDNISVKTNMVVTEAQIHLEKYSNEEEVPNIDLTVKLDSANNVSIESSNLKVTHKDMSEQTETGMIIASKDETLKNQITKEESPATPTQIELEQNLHNIQSPKSSPPLGTNNSDMNTDNFGNESLQEQAIISVKDSNNLTENELNKGNNVQDLQDSPKRRKSFQIISGPTSHEEKSKQELKDLEQLDPSVEKKNDLEILPVSNDTILGEEINNKNQHDRASEEKQQENNIIYIGNKSSDILQEQEKITPVAKENNRAVQQILLDNDSDDNTSRVVQSSKVIRKSSKDSQISSRKSSIYETESYKVLSDVASATDAGPGILKKTKVTDVVFDDVNMRETSLHPSISDNEIYSHLESNGRRKRFRKKGRARSRTISRSKSENSERGYESSGLMDSGFEPSPRVVQRRIMSPRLAAYYQQRKASGKFSAKVDSRIPVRKPGDKLAVDMKSVTQKIQTNMRRYYCERKIFQHLLELKRIQIRTSKTNEAVLVKRAIDDYNKSSLAHVGLGPYNSPDYSYSSFEKFLYDSLRKLQKSSKRHLDNLPEKPIDFDYGESELYKMVGIPDKASLCTSKTHRCFHAVHAYTGIPCSAYIPKWNHHTMPKPIATNVATKSRGFLPKIKSKPSSGKAHVTLEVSHGTEKQLIALPAEKLDKNKRYYVTFTVKGSEPQSENDNTSLKSE